MVICSLCRVQLSWDNPPQRLVFKRTLLSIWKMIASHRYAGAEGWIDMAPEHIALTSRSCVTRPCPPLHNSHHRLACLSMALLLAVPAARTAACCKGGKNTAHLFLLLHVAEPKCCFLHSWHSQLQRGAQPLPMPSCASHRVLAVASRPWPSRQAGSGEHWSMLRCCLWWRGGQRSFLVLVLVGTAAPS